MISKNDFFRDKGDSSHPFISINWIEKARNEFTSREETTKTLFSLYPETDDF